MQSQHETWLNILKHAAEIIPKAEFITWFKNTAALSMTDDEVVIGSPLPIACNRLESHYKEPMLLAIQKECPNVKKLSYAIDPSLSEKDPRVIRVLDLFVEKKRPRKLPGRAEVKVVEGITSKILNPRYSFDNFIVGSNNRLAHAACLAVAHSPGTNYNPLFIYGGVGLGKTHLLQAIGNEVLDHSPDKYVAYITAEDFTNEVVEAIKKQNMPKLRDRYRKLDVFIIDDIQFIANKDRTQEEFFHTFNALYDAGKQVIVSSDRPPYELDILEPRLKSRFEMGMIADVSAPDYETRVAILHRKAAACDIMLTPEIYEFIATNIKGNVRELEGVLKQVVAQLELGNATPTIRSLAEMFKKMNKQLVGVGYEQPRNNEFIKTFDELINIVCGHFHVPREEMVGHSRLREYMVPRQIAMYLAKNHMNISVTRIASVFDGRDHTSVLHALKKVSKSLNNDQQLMRNINAIKEECGFR